MIQENPTYSRRLMDRLSSNLAEEPKSADLVEVGPSPWDNLVGRSPAMQELFRQIELVAQTDATVLVEGETGTGKDLVARTLHSLGHRARKPFVAVNASNLQENLFESELFGHVKGAFSGALEHHEGLARAADGGTLLIDEVGELSLPNQAKLLRFLDSKEVRPVGGVRPVKVNVRIICATNRDLLAEVERGRFREDLYYRLRVITLRVPSLRERKEDLPLLICHFLRKFRAQYEKDIDGLTEEAMQLLISHSWCGNVRELENEIERAVVLTPCGEKIAAVVLSPQLRRGRSNGKAVTASALRQFRRDVEKQLVQEALKRTGWNVTAAARDLGISRVGLSKKLKTLGIRRPSPDGQGENGVGS